MEEQNKSIYDRMEDSLKDYKDFIVKQERVETEAVIPSPVDNIIKQEPLETEAVIESQVNQSTMEDHSKTVNNKKKICPFCERVYRNELKMKEHILQRHDSVEFAQCETCFKNVPSKQHLPDHLCDKTFVCYECSPKRNLLSEAKLHNHQAKFHNKRNLSVFRCHICNLTFLTPRKLRKHKKATHPFSKIYSCQFCDEHFTSDANVKAHERIHAKTTKTEC